MDRFLGNLGLPAYLLATQESVLPLSGVLSIYDEAARLAGDEYFCARRAMNLTVQDLGEFGDYVMAAPSLTSVAARANALIGNLQQATRIWLEPHGDELRWSYRIEAPISVGRRQDAEFAVAILINALRQKTCGRVSPAAIHLEHTGTGRARRDLEDLFEAPVHFDQPSNALVINRGLVKMTPELRAVTASAHLTSTPPAALPPTLTGAIRLLLESALNGGAGALVEIARLLGTSPRSLQRRLDSEATSFSEVLEELRRTEAERRVRAGADSITDIALALGYSDPSHFTRAFRRWTGQSPSAFRATGAHCHENDER